VVRDRRADGPPRLRELREKNLISVAKEYKEAPLAPEGYTAVNFYTLLPPFGPKSVEGVVEF